jgi:hypothetical protein
MSEEDSYEYLSEFTLKSAKRVTSMNELSETEIDLFRKYLEEEWDVVEDFFGDDDWSSDDLRVMEWQWKDKTLLDINGWPGDNENGAIFMDGKIIFTNGDQDFSETEGCPNELRDRMGDFCHLRRFQCTESHSHCEIQTDNHENFVPGGDFYLDSKTQVSEVDVKYQQYLKGDRFIKLDWYWNCSFYSYPLTDISDSEGNSITFLDHKLVLVNMKPIDDTPSLLIRQLNSFIHIRRFSCNETGHIYCHSHQRKYHELV